MFQRKIIENIVKIQNDGTVEVDVAHNAPVASELLALDAVNAVPFDDGETLFEFSKTVPTMKIAILVVGTRGDVQPFIAIAKRLQARTLVNLIICTDFYFIRILDIFTPTENLPRAKMYSMRYAVALTI